MIDLKALAKDAKTASSKIRAEMDEAATSDAKYLASDEHTLEAEFQTELKAEEDAAIEEKRKAFMAKRKKK